MTIHRTLAHAVEYLCDECGAVDRWQPGRWRRISTDLCDEECPNEMPTLCSQACAEAFQVRLDIGTAALPVVKPSKCGWYVEQTQAGRGYPCAPARIERVPAHLVHPAWRDRTRTDAPRQR